MDHDPLEVGAGPHPDVVAEHGVLAQPGARLDAAVVADDRRAHDGGIGVDLGALPEPDPLGDAEARDVDLDLAVEDVLVGPDVGVEGADVLPVALGHAAEERLAVVEERREDLAGEVDGPVGRDVVEDLGLEHEDAGVDGVAEHLAPGGLLEEPLDRAVVAGDDDAELERVVDGDQPDGGQGARAPRGRRRSSPRSMSVSTSPEITRNRSSSSSMALRTEPAVPSGRLLGGVDHADAELGAVAEVVADGVGHEGDASRRSRRCRGAAAGRRCAPSSAG